MKTKIVMFLFVLLGINSFGQAPNWAWTHSAGGTSIDYGSSVCSDASGNVYVTGYFQSATITFGAITLTNVNNTGTQEDLFIVKYDATGNVIWAKSAGGTSGDLGKSVSTNASGDVFITGYFLSDSITFGTITLSNSHIGWEDLFIVKYDSSGNVIWAKTAGGSGNDQAEYISTDIAGNLFITGNFNSPSMTFGTTTLINSGNNDVFIVKYNSAGNVLWAKSAGGSSYDYSVSVATDASGNAFITGSFSSPSIVFGTITLTNASTTGSSDIFLVKYDAFGNVIWANSTGGYSEEMGYGVSTDAIGNVSVTGYFYSTSVTFGATTLLSSGLGDIFIAKYDSGGNALWAKMAGGNAPDQGHSVCNDVGGNVFITGFFESSNLLFGISSLNNFNASSIADIFVAKYDSSGNFLWAKSVGGSAPDFGLSIATNGNGDILMTGSFNSPSIDFGTIILINADTSNISDIFIAKLNGTTGIQEFNSENEISISPNPFTSTTTISFSEKLRMNGTGIYSIKIVNVLGFEILRFALNDKSATIDLSGVANGIYFVEGRRGNEVFRKKMVKQ